MPTYQEVTLPIKFIYDEMFNNVNGSKVAYIRTLNQLMIPKRENETVLGKMYRYARQPGEWLDQPADKVIAYLEWIMMVAPTRPWDHKDKILSKHGGEWTVDHNLGYLFNFDIWSNMHYGYIGTACEFTEWELLSGGGAAQVYAQTNPPGYWDRRFSTHGDWDFLGAFDDPLDQVAIKLGIALWNRHRTGISPAIIRQAVNSQITSLNTKSAPMQRYDYGYKTGFA